MSESFPGIATNSKGKERTSGRWTVNFESRERELSCSRMKRNEFRVCGSGPRQVPFVSEMGEWGGWAIQTNQYVHSSNGHGHRGQSLNPDLHSKTIGSRQTKEASVKSSGRIVGRLFASVQVIPSLQFFVVVFASSSRPGMDFAIDLRW